MQTNEQQQTQPEKPAAEEAHQPPPQPEVLRTATASPVHQPKKFGKDGCGY
jgi:hypothetical protein